MIYYDSDPGYGGGVVKYQGAVSDKDPNTFRSFKDAQNEAIARIMGQISDLQDELELVKNMTPKTCPLVRNPF